MRYVCAAWPGLDMPASVSYRLYAYPRAPQHAGFTILDSGAFGLAQAGLHIGAKHISQLAEYYAEHRGEGVHCIAPDVYLGPAQTMRNWMTWQEQHGLPVVPVIQFARGGRLDVSLALQQARFYAGYDNVLIAISNPGLQAIEAQSAMRHICGLVRAVTGASQLHCLGAGWSPADIALWRDMQCFDSIDSIAWYTDAQAGWLWRIDGGRELSNRPWREIAVVNAHVAQEVAEGVL